MATRLPKGSMELHDADVKVLGATMAQMMASSPAAIQIVAKRVPNRALLISVRPAVRRGESASTMLSEMPMLSDKRFPLTRSSSTITAELLLRRPNSTADNSRPDRIGFDLGCQAEQGLLDPLQSRLDHIR